MSDMDAVRLVECIERLEERVDALEQDSANPRDRLREQRTCDECHLLFANDERYQQHLCAGGLP